MPKLVINPTSASKKEIPIVSRVISIGRDPSNDLVLSDSMVSRRHAILEQRDDTFVLRDNGSSNGTLVNGDRVEREKTLRDGDLVAIGSSRLLFQLDEAGAKTPAGSGDVPSSGLEGSQEAGPARAAEPAPASSCPACGKPTIATDRFCRACGTPLIQKKSVLCTACGHDVPLPAEFCGRCGHELPDKDKSFPPTKPQKLSDLHPATPASPSKSGPGAPASARPRPRPPLPKGMARRLGEPAGFGIRLVSAIVDEMILGIPLLMGTLLWVTFGASGIGGDVGPRSVSPGALLALALLFSLLCVLYYLWFWAVRGATPGKSLLGLVIRTESGETPIGLKRAALRLIGYLASSLVLGLGFAMIAFSEDKRGLHDRIAGTRVTRDP